MIPKLPRVLLTAPALGAVLGVAAALSGGRVAPRTWVPRADAGQAAVEFEGGPPIQVAGSSKDEAPRFAPEAHGGGLLLNSRADVWSEATPGAVTVPREAFTAWAWVSIDTPQRWGGIIGRLEDNGGFEQGWLLGYDEERFTFGLQAIDEHGRLFDVLTLQKRGS